MRSFGLLVLVAAMTIGCSKEENGSVELVLKGVYGDEPLVMFRDYKYAFDDTVTFSKADLYMSNVRMISASGNVDALDVELVDLSFSNEDDARNGFIIPLGEIEAVTYDRMDFVIGLNSEMNSGRPEDYPSSSPLSLPRYWEPWSSYIFAKLEGTLDTLGGNDSNLGWAYHTGTDGMSSSLSTSPMVPINVLPDQTLQIVLTIDFRTVLGLGNDPINIKRKPQNHNPADTIELRKIVQNYPASMTVEIQ